MSSNFPKRRRDSRSSSWGGYRLRGRTTFFFPAILFTLRVGVGSADAQRPLEIPDPFRTPSVGGEQLSPDGCWVRYRTHPRTFPDRRSENQVHLAETGEEALELAAGLETPPDLLLSDVLLPGMTGAELAWTLAERWPDLTVVFTSGYTHGELMNQDVELRSARFLSKPFGPAELSEVVAEALRSSR